MFENILPWALLAILTGATVYLLFRHLKMIKQHRGTSTVPPSPNTPEALVEQVMAGVRESLGKSEYEWVVKSPECYKAFLLGALTALSQQVDETYLRKEFLGLLQLSLFGGNPK